MDLRNRSSLQKALGPIQTLHDVLQWNNVRITFKMRSIGSLPASSSYLAPRRGDLGQTNHHPRSCATQDELLQLGWRESPSAGTV
jgi:hypothetical protein